MARRIITTGIKSMLFAGASALMLSAGAAYAQDEPAEGEGVEVEAVTIVGSQIKGSRATEALPVTVMEVEDIDAAAPGSGDELFRSIPQAGDVTFTESRTTGGINDARGDTASINLRSIGTGNTLMLLNGRRLVLHPAIQVENLVPAATVNTNAIPVSGVRRVEVLRDGAAAIYGTDAVAGVINTVLKSNFDGFTISSELQLTEDSQQEQFEINFEAGKTFNNGRTNFSLFGSYVDRDPLWAYERDFSRNSDLRGRFKKGPWVGDTDWQNTSLDTPWGEFQRLTNSYVASTTAATYNGTSFTSSGIFHVQPDTNEGCIVPLAGGVCYDNSTLSTASTDNNLRYNSNDERTIWGEVQRTNLFSFFNHEFENGIELFAEAGYYGSSSTGSREQETTLASQRVIVPVTGYWNPLGPVGSPNRLPLLGGVLNAGVPVELLDYRLVDAGAQTYTVDQTVTRYLAGVRGEWSGWDWESALVYSRAETEDVQRAPSLTLFQAALGGTTADTAYNPFNGGNPLDPANGDSSPNPDSVIASFMVPVSRESHTSLTLWDFKVSNPAVFTWWGGDIGMAAGVELRRETYGDDRDRRLDGTLTFTDLAGVTTGSDVMGVSPTPDTSGARNVQSAWIEFAVPLVPRGEIPGIYSLDLQLAGRFENYSLFGEVAKPKVALSYRPFDFLQIRAAWSEGFRAPNLPQQYERGIIRSNGRTDWIRCEVQLRNGAIPNFDACSASVSVSSNRSGNTSLTPEESENFTVGMTFESTFIPRRFGRFTATVDYWKIEQTNIIGIFGDANALTLDYLLRVNGSFNPNVERIAPTAQEQADWTAAGFAGVAPGRVSQVIDNYRNLGPREVEGLDIGVSYSIDDTPWGDFDLKVNAAQLLTFYQTPGPEQSQLLAAQAAGVIDGTIPIVGAEDLIEQNGRPEWRWTASLTWRYGQFGAGWYTSYVGPVEDTSATLADGTRWEVASMQTHNFYFQYTFDTNDWADGTRIRFGARNIFDEQPPLADSDLGFLGELHSPRGRVVYAQIRKRF
jgi:outer membrane receptor protein involved in Fe transport